MDEAKDKAGEVAEQVEQAVNEVSPVAIPISEGLSWTAQLAIILVVAVIAWMLVHLLTRHWVRIVLRADPAVAATEDYRARHETLTHVALRTFEVLIISLTAITLLSHVGIDIAPVLAGAGVVGIAVGFGAQSLVRDTLAGVLILAEHQFVRGDIVGIGSVTGVVEDVNLRRTVVRDLDGVVHFVPNGEITVASNFSKGWARVNLNIEVAYEESLDRVREIIDRTGQELASDPKWADLIIDPPKVLRVDELGGPGVEFKILGDVKANHQWAVTGELRRRLKAAFDAEGVEMPVPQRKLLFDDRGRGIDELTTSPAGGGGEG